MCSQLIHYRVTQAKQFLWWPWQYNTLNMTLHQPEETWWPLQTALWSIIHYTHWRCGNTFKAQCIQDTNVLLTLLSAVNCHVGRLIISQVIRDVRKLLYTPLLTIHVLQNAILERTTNTNRSMTWLEKGFATSWVKARSKIIERSTAEEGRLGCLRPRAHCPQPRWRLLA